VKHAAAADVLSPADEQLLRFGPSPPTYQQPSMAEHARLRGVWALHGAAIRSSMPRDRRGKLQLPWFVQRDWFVRQIRGEPSSASPR
jgi:hypothetical protein